MDVASLFHRPYFYAVATTLLFASAIFIGVLPVTADWVHLLAKALLAMAFLVLAAWFLHAFTRPDAPDGDSQCHAEERASMFRFAYVFAIFAFALLVLPFTAMVRREETPPDAGPIRLLRACLKVSPSARPASAPGPIEACPDAPLEGTFTYPWLLSVGGVVAQECGTAAFPCPRVVEAAQRVAGSAAGARPGTDSAPPGGAASPPSAPAPERAASGPALYSVSGGFVVPFYVVVFAFIGGVVNLTRRVPEYQKRSSCAFKGTPAESAVTLLEAREFVIFQLMQMLSSPFVAMVAFYALEPKTITSAVALAFVSGFSTEAVLLLIRGAVNGIKPETTTKTVAASTPTTGATLHVNVQHGGAPALTATVEVRRLPNATPPLKTATVDANGDAEFKDLAVGTVWVVATLAQPAPAPALTAAQQVQLTAGATQSVTLTL